jgi:hypothetical protein
MQFMRREEWRLLLLAAVVSVPVAILAVGAAITPETTDFRCFWTGAAFVATGRDPYDVTEWTRATSGVALDLFGRIRPSNCPGSYAYPLTTAIAMLPLGLLPLGIAAAIWELMIFATALAGTTLLARAAGLSRNLSLVFIVLVLMSQPFEQTVMSAQFGGLSLLALGLLAAPNVGSGRASLGVVLAAMKPHVIPLVPLIRARGESARSIILAVAPIAALVLVSLAVRPTWPLSWVAELGGQRREMFAASVSVWTLASVVQSPLLGPLLVAAAIVPMAFAARRARDLHVLDVIALVALAWLVVVPYGLTSDQPAPLAVAWVAILRRAVVPTVSPILVAALFVVAAILPWALFGTRFELLAYNGLELNGALVPVATAILLASALARSPRAVFAAHESANRFATSP